MRLGRLGVVGVVLAVSMPVFAESTSGWLKLNDQGGVTVYSKDIPNSDIVAFRGDTVIEAPIAKVAQVLIDTSRKKEWVAKIVEAKDIRSLSNNDRIEYNHTSAPWPLQDRDFVFHAKVETDVPNKKMYIRLNSVKDAAVPEYDGIVRGELSESVYELTSLNDGKSTQISVEIHADPKGSVPKWIVNLFQKSWPRTTLENIRKQVNKPDVIEHAQVKALFGPSIAQAEEAAPVSGVKK